ncbi:hypothetical protein CYMTET_50994 [Cymbomonas tetramitiformis]|uniref:Nucleotide-diphospho-sugar transferase domain-containing protein n=1 Tax=Cymbomonas tetramitiformis TaxID=36881 RepID=A0AAE0BN92_9CHLO|nr:hypothetical protein CYMTET_50994 [Cymbomonas tetramitiformis]
MLTFGSKAVSDFILNWVKSVERIPSLRPYVVAALDVELLTLCREKGIPVFLAQGGDIIGDKRNLGVNGQAFGQNIGADRYYRTDGAAFKKMGAVKAKVLQTMLEAAYDVFISDADVVWFADPWPVVGRVTIPWNAVLRCAVLCCAVMGQLLNPQVALLGLRPP